MYKAVDIERARKNISRHKWARDLYAGIKSGAEYYLGMDRNRLRSFISDQTPLITVKCPSCDCGPWYAYALINEGETLQCLDCKTSWNWDPQDTTEEWNIQAVIRSYRLKHIVGGLDSAGLVYQIEGDSSYAEVAAILIERFAEVFHSYRINRVNRNEWQEENDPNYGKIDGWKQRDAGALRPVLHAYDLIRESGCLSESQCLTIDKDLVAYARDYFVQSFHNTTTSLEGYNYTDDMSPYLSHYSIQDHGGPWWCIAASAAILGDTKFLQSVVTLYEDMLNPKFGVFHEDGTFYECAADYTLGLLQASQGIAEIVRGNIEPDVYTNPKCSLWEKCYTWFLDASFPNDTIPAINDSHVGSSLRPFCSEIAYINYGNRKALAHLKSIWGPDLSNGTKYSLFYRDPDTSIDTMHEPYGEACLRLDAMGIMMLRHGNRGPEQTVAYIDYGPYIPAAHKQKDYLNFGLWSSGHEIVTEMGYNWNPEWARLWERSERSHNTVFELASQGEGGQPLTWCITPGPKIAEAGLPGTNSRLIALLPIAHGPPLIVDIFRISGTEDTYTWMLHSRFGTLEIDGVDNLKDTDVPEPLRSGKMGQSADQVVATWLPNQDEPCGHRVILPYVAGSTITLSECPPEEDVIDDLHEAGGTLKSGASIPYRGHLQVTRKGPETVFVAIHAPFQGSSPNIDVNCEPVGTDGLFLEVDIVDETFTLLHNSGQQALSHGDFYLEGRCGIASGRAGSAVSLTLGAGRRVCYGKYELMREQPGNAFGIVENSRFIEKQI